MDDNELSLKEVLLSVSHKLDRFLETHSDLHTTMAQHETKVDQILTTHEGWGNEVRELREWRVEVQGQLKLLKWMAGGGLIGAASIVLKLMGVPLP